MIKLLACNCYVKKIQEKFALGNFQLKYLNTVFCEFGYEEHIHFDYYLVSIWKDSTYNLHPKSIQILQRLRRKCNCANLGPFEKCSYWVNLCYMLNFCVHIICIDKNTFQSFGFEIKNLTDYLRDNLLVDPFFVFNIHT